MRAGAALATGCAFTVACAEPVQHLHLPLPSLGAERSVIVAADEANARGFRMFAAAVAGKVAIPAESGVSVTLHLLAYGESLEELGLEVGPLDEPSSCRRDCGRLKPSAMFEATGDPDSLEWRPIPELPQSLIDRLVSSAAETCGPCRRFDQDLIPLPASGAPRVAIELANGDVLVAAQSGELFDFHPGGEFELRCMLPDGTRAGALRASDGTLVFALLDGRVIRVTDPSACAFEELGTFEGEPVQMAVSDSGPLVAYVFSNAEGDAMLWRVETSSSALVHHHVVDPEYVRFYQRSYIGDVLWLGPEHVLFVAGDDAIFRLRDGAVRKERLDGEELVYRAQSLLETPLGTIAGVQPWGVAVDTGGSWTRTYAEPTWYAITALGRYQDVVLIGEDGTLEIYDPENRGYCPRFSDPVAQHLPQALVPLGASEAIIVDASGDGAATALRHLVRKDDLCE